MSIETTVPAELAVMMDAEPVSAEVVAAKIKSLSEGSFVWSPSLNADTSFEDRAAIVRAMTTAAQLSDNMNKPFPLVTFVAQGVELSPDAKTGEVTNAIRTVLVCADGTAYAAISDGIFKALQVMTKVLGPVETWPEGGVMVRAVSGKGQRGQFYTLELV